SRRDRKSTRLNSSHLGISYAVFCLKKIARHIDQAQCRGFCVADKDEKIKVARASRRILSPPQRFFFNDPATTEIYTLSLHDALPISSRMTPFQGYSSGGFTRRVGSQGSSETLRSEEHTSELQSLTKLVCRLLLE